MVQKLKNIAGLLGAVPLLNANAQIAAHIESAFAALPSCVAAVAADQTHSIAIADSSDVLGSAFDGKATDDGFIVLSRPAVDKWLILHELGHEVAIRFDLAHGSEFVQALRADFRSLGAREREQLAYFLRPDEAFAELFAALYDREDIAARDPQIMWLARTLSLEKSMLDGLEGCGQSK